MSDYIDAVEHVLEELREYGGRQKTIGGNIHILCPMPEHDENSPSCSVNVSYENDVGIGTFFCFGCGATGGWNELAKHAGLRPVKGWQNKVGKTDYLNIRRIKMEASLLGKNNQSLQRLFDEVGNAVIEWPRAMSWRSYSGKLLHRVGAYCFNDRKTDELQALFPVYTNGRYRGGVRALTEKPAYGPSYLTTKGNWVRDYGLLGYEYMRKKKLYGCKALVAVEGPRDWLRMIRNQIPSCGILGSKMMSPKKMMLISSLGVKKIYSLPDNDRAGGEMAEMIGYYAAKAGLEHEYLRLPRKLDENGELIKVDPDNASPKIIKKVKKLVYAYGK
jgi:5S rRNA maturation endonuclease (ribonuclease M5)